MTDEKKSQIIGIAVMVIIVFGIGIMLICSKNMKKKEKVGKIVGIGKSQEDGINTRISYL